MGKAERGGMMCRKGPLNAGFNLGAVCSEDCICLEAAINQINNAVGEKETQDKTRISSATGKEESGPAKF